ncbi:18506_t:CDS:2 [Dentiscutata erythropus]|uniref:18506_t:CDS:1 n=1 Tax=Dentiscutata erythropus TaxID=1348616 RepID=A0A9N9FBP0_9GLOM|nr:18506_t:CDS:2 [Dentiscutata erythropus]
MSLNSQYNQPVFNPAELESIILATSPDTFSPINRLENSLSLSLQEYLNNYLLPATQDNATLDDIKKALHGEITNYAAEGFPIFPHINFSEFKLDHPRKISFRYDIDSFLLTTYNLKIIKKSIKFFCFTNVFWNLNRHNHEYCYVLVNNNIRKHVKLVNVPHFQFAQFGDNGVFKILIFFPSKYTDGSRNSFLQNEVLAIWYDEIFIPSLKEIHCPLDILHHYPSTFRAYCLKSKNDSGYYNHSSYSLPNSFLFPLTETMRAKIRSNDNLKQFEHFFYHIYAKNLKLDTKFYEFKEINEAISFIDNNFDTTNNISWKNAAKIDFGIEFMPTGYNQPNSVYWARNSAINLLKGLGTIFTTNTTLSRIDNFLHTYELAGGSGEAKEIGKRNHIYYAQVYNVEKEAFSAATTTLLKKLNENNAIKHPTKINKVCEASIEILNEIVNTNFGARAEYRIIYENLVPFVAKLENRVYNFLYSKPFYIIPTKLVSNLKIAKLKTFINAYNLSFHPIPDLLTSKHEAFRISLLYLMKTINQSFDALPFITKYFGNSDLDNENNIGTLEMHRIMKQANTAWLLDIFNIDSLDLIWIQFIQDCINAIPERYKIQEFSSPELTLATLNTNLTSSNYKIFKLSDRKRKTGTHTVQARFDMYFNHEKDLTVKQKNEQKWINKYLDVYQFAYLHLKDINSKLVEFRTKLLDKFKQQQYLPVAEKNGKFCVSKNDKVQILDMTI